MSAKISSARPARQRARLRRRLSALGILGLAVVSGIALFWTAQRVQTGEAQLHHLQDSATNEQESLRVLRAEWDYLNRPDRLEALARTQLGMVPPRAGAVADANGALQTAPATPATTAAPLKVAAPAPAAEKSTRPPAQPATDQKSFNDLLDSVAKSPDGRKDSR